MATGITGVSIVSNKAWSWTGLVELTALAVTAGRVGWWTDGEGGPACSFRRPARL